MFEKLMATAVLPASDIARAKQWWHDVLGHDPVYEDTEGEALFYDLGGMPLMVYRSDYAGTAQNTSLNLVTDDLDRDMTALRAKGVVFHEYDLPGIKTENGVVDMDGERGAWFDDSEGNIIALAQPTSVTMDEARAMLAGMRLN